jgi:hypothetical protein
MIVSTLRRYPALFIVMLAISPVSCTKPHQYIDMTCSKMPGETLVDRETAIQCQTFRQAEAATAVYNEAQLLMKSYRACLAKYEQTTGRPKEYCSEYSRALTEIACSKIAGDYALGPEAAAQCENTRQAEAATGVYNEAMRLVKSYRGCLERYEQEPARAREYCAPYPKALKEIGLQIKEQPESLTNGTASKARSR